MKTKVLLLSCLLLILSIGKMNAQNNVVKEVVTVQADGSYLECTGDYLFGTVEVENLYMNKNWVTIVKKVELFGCKDAAGTIPSGNIYEASQVITGPSNWVNTLKLKLNGKMVAVCQWHYHLTTNANGETTASFYTFKVNCM